MIWVLGFPSDSYFLYFSLNKTPFCRERSAEYGSIIYRTICYAQEVEIKALFS